jgi:GNAT superfamily N-acetyltransferase
MADDRLDGPLHKRDCSWCPLSSRIPRSREGRHRTRDDDQVVDTFVLEAAAAVFAVSFCVWVAFAFAILVGRLRYDRSREGESSHDLSPRAASRLTRRVRGTPRTDWGRWRRVTALQRLERAHHPAVSQLIRVVLDDPNERVAAAGIRTLGDIGDEWAIDILVDALRRGQGSRSRIAAELEQLAPAPGHRLVPLLRDWNPAVRFWGATLLQTYPDLAEPSLVELTWDPDPNVRAAAVETLGTRSGKSVETALLARLDDSEWFVRVHAARAAGHVAGAEAAPSITRLLADDRWWVRTAAKDALRGMGSDAVPSLLSVLTHDDLFARNGAAEVLQDIGFVDFLVFDNPRSPLLERIYAAGGERYRDAAEARRDELTAANDEARVA